MKQIILSSLVFLVSLDGYSQSHKEEVEGKVLSHFKHDNLKYKAAKFLFDNMDAHYSLYSKDIETYYHKMDSAFCLPSQKYKSSSKSYHASQFSGYGK